MVCSESLYNAMSSRIEQSFTIKCNYYNYYNLQIIYMICVKKSKYLAVVRGNVTCNTLKQVGEISKKAFMKDETRILADNVHAIAEKLN